MSWTAPYLWVTGMTVTAANLNMYVSANDTYLKTYVDLISPTPPANQVFASAVSGGAAAMAARALVVADLPVAYVESTWTPVPTALTVVGTPTYTGTYTKIGRRVFFVISCIATTSTAATGGTTCFTLPSTPARSDTCYATNISVANYGTGVAYTDGKVYVPTWSAIGVTVIISGSYDI